MLEKKNNCSEKKFQWKAQQVLKMVSFHCIECNQGMKLAWDCSGKYLLDENLSTLEMRFL